MNLTGEETDEFLFRFPRRKHLSLRRKVAVLTEHEPNLFERKKNIIKRMELINWGR